jgi:hypothetical protein
VLQEALIEAEEVAAEDLAAAVVVVVEDSAVVSSKDLQPVSWKSLLFHTPVRVTS